MWFVSGDLAAVSLEVEFLHESNVSVSVSVSVLYVETLGCRFLVPFSFFPFLPCLPLPCLALPRVLLCVRRVSQ